ncbi:MAG: TetR/AcrR family transcriptional regulator [Microbacteriaceae bacterium]|nr:TetR/AcrR family transcriptional regulator [Microbacteriaceae bacterium]
MPKVTEEYRVSKRAEITSAAMRAFRRKGFHATSMADIITESGLSAGAIYGHFGGKNDIVLEVASRVIDARIGKVEELSSARPLPAPAELLRLLASGLAHDLGRPAMLVQLWGEAVTEPALRALWGLLVGRLRAAYCSYLSLWHQSEHGATVADADRLAAEQVVLFLSCAQGYILQSALVTEFDGEAFLRSMELHLPR